MKAIGVRFGSQADPATSAPAKEAAKTADDNDDDAIDIFGEETEEKKKAIEARESAKASTKKKESRKSSVLMNIKPWDDETDIMKLEEAVRSIKENFSNLVGTKLHRVYLDVAHWWYWKHHPADLDDRTELRDDYADSANLPEDTL
ncbi:Elongation factor 1-beta 1 [Capsicum baccatum]|uniref:Elongation factor 1-beta 1 n=1 Tax=Capsicum baccatum TaxID=33114 RepID=A0A2G2UWB4_CAPBA|nr:Elongation factor 1-beta 1 [Capsicum baccatum]